MPDRRQNVIAFSRFRKQQDKRDDQTRTNAFPKVANLASAILILVTVATLARYVSHSFINPATNDSVAYQNQIMDDDQSNNESDQKPNAVPSRKISYLPNAPALPDNFNIDDLARYRSRYLKKKIRIKPMIATISIPPTTSLSF